MFKLRLLLILSLFWLAAACTPADPTRPPTQIPTLAAARLTSPAAVPKGTATIERSALSVSATPAVAPATKVTPTALLTPAVDPLACLPDNPGETGMVSWVVDGETFVIDQGGKRQTVRLLGVDAPPLAEQMTRSLVDQRVVRLISDGRNADSSGRLLRYVLLLDGRFVNDELLRSGVARLDPDVRGLECMTQFKFAEEFAIQQNLGLWAMAAVAELPTALQPTASSTASAVAAASPQPGLPTTTAAPTATGAIITSVASGTEPPFIPSLPAQAVTPTATRPAPTGTVTGTGVQIINIFFDGVKGASEPDEYIEIKNFNQSPADLSYWLINAEANELWYIFPEFILQPGQSCRIYSNEVNADTCAGDSFLDSLDNWQVWDNTADCAYLYNYADVDPVSTKCYGQ